VLHQYHRRSKFVQRVAGEFGVLQLDHVDRMGLDQGADPTGHGRRVVAVPVVVARSLRRLLEQGRDTGFDQPPTLLRIVGPADEHHHPDIDRPHHPPRQIADADRPSVDHRFDAVGADNQDAPSRAIVRGDRDHGVILTHGAGV
jgi:hypothetical protein